MAAPEKPKKRMLTPAEAEVRGYYKRMKSNSSPARDSADQHAMEIDEPAAQVNISQSDQLTRPAYLGQTAPNESVFIPANVLRVLTLDGTTVETVLDANPSTGDAVVVPGEVEAAAQGVIVYLKPPRPKRGEGDYTTNLFWPPDFPAELRIQIWRDVAVSDHPITINDFDTLSQKYYTRHCTDCTHGAGDKPGGLAKYFVHNGREKSHTRESREGDKSKYIGPKEIVAADGYCIHPHTNRRTMIKVPNSVLDLRLVCKQLNDELTPIFWKENAFIFLDAEDMFMKLDGLHKNAQSAQLKYSKSAFNSGYSEILRDISKVELYFSPKKAPLYFRIAAMLPRVKVLVVNLSHDASYITFDTDVKIRGKNPLSKARSLDMLAEAFNKHTGPCKEIHTVIIYGTDLIKTLTINEDEWYTEKVSINHSRAIGPVLRRNILEVNGPWLPSMKEIDESVEKKKREQEEIKRKEEEQAKLKVKKDAEKLEKKRKQNEEIMRKKIEEAMLKAKKDAEKLNRQPAQKLASPSAADKTEMLARQKYKTAERERQKERGYTDVQLAQVRLHEQALGRDKEGYREVVNYWSEFVGPINLPRLYNTYAEWCAANGNVAAINPPPPNHKDTPKLADLEKFRKANDYEEVREQRHYQTILPKAPQAAPTALDYGVQAQHCQGQNGNDYAAEAYGIGAFSPQNLQQAFGNVQVQHIQAHNGQGMNFGAMGVPLQGIQGQNFYTQGTQVQGFPAQPNYGQNSQAQNFAATAFHNTNGNSMINVPFGQSIFGPPANTQHGPAIQHFPLGMNAAQTQRPGHARRETLNALADARPRSAGQTGQFGMAPPRTPLPDPTARRSMKAPPGLAIQRSPRGLNAGQTQNPARAPREGLNAPTNARPGSAAQLTWLAPVTPSNERAGHAARGSSKAPANPAAQGRPRVKRNPQKARPTQVSRGPSTSRPNAQSRPATQQGGVRANAAQRPPPNQATRVPSNAAANVEHFSRYNSHVPPARSIFLGAPANPRPAPAAQHSLGDPANIRPAPASRGNGGNLEDAPPGYGGFSICPSSGGPSQSFGNNNNNFGGSNHQN